MAVVGLRDLCSPAIFYLAISLITLGMMFYQNYTNTDVYCLGVYSCKPTVSIYFIFITMLVTILFWTWILNIICHNGSTAIAWFLVLLPYLIFLITVLYVMFM
jgi:hypothetical protein